MTLRFTTMIVAVAASASTAFAQAPAPAPAKAPNANAIIDIKGMTPEQRSAAILAQYSEPVFDPQSAQRTEDAIKRYKAIAAKGGWPAIPAEAKYAAGAEGADVDLLRRRLVITGDLFTVENTGPYNDELIAGVKRFQLRNGLLATGLVGPRTLAALNVPVEKRIQQLEASLQRMQALGFKFGDRYVVVNIPAA
jgi:murein L,D-transpeptidase YcbB/YkuD